MLCPSMFYLEAVRVMCSLFTEETADKFDYLVCKEVVDNAYGTEQDDSFEISPCFEPLFRFLKLLD